MASKKALTRFLPVAKLNLGKVFASCVSAAVTCAFAAVFSAGVVAADKVSSAVFLASKAFSCFKISCSFVGRAIFNSSIANLIGVVSREDSLSSVTIFALFSEVQFPSMNFIKVFTSSSSIPFSLDRAACSVSFCSSADKFLSKEDLFSSKLLWYAFCKFTNNWVILLSFISRSVRSVASCLSIN